MIRAEFKKIKGLYGEFSVSGHAGYAESGQDIVCAAVSSATQLIVNVLNELGCEPYASAEDNTVICRTTASAETASQMIRLFKEHLQSISEEFPKTIKITISEV